MHDLALPPRAASIGDGAFNGCISLERVAIPEGVETLGQVRWDRDEEEDDDGGLDFEDTATRVFGGCLALKEAKLPSTLRKIDPRAFAGCLALEKIEVAAGSPFVFADGWLTADSGRKIVFRTPAGGHPEFPPGAAEMGEYAFSARDGGADWSVAIPEGVTAIAPRAFKGCGSLVGVVLPAALREIGEEAFAECGRLTAIRLPASLERLGARAFSHCGALGTVDIPEGVTHIPDACFRRCEAMSSVRLPRGLAKIGASAFSSTGLEDIDLPEGLGSIGDHAFGNCSRLSSAAIPEGVKAVDGFDGCTALSRVLLHAETEAILAYAFEGCTALEEIALPEGLKSIGTSAFAGSGLKTVTIPSTVESIGHRAFAECTDLELALLPAGLTASRAVQFWRCAKLAEITRY